MMEKYWIAFVLCFVAINAHAAMGTVECASVSSSLSFPTTPLLQNLQAPAIYKIDTPFANADHSPKKALDIWVINSSGGNSMAESLVVVLCIPCIIIVWGSRFSKSLK